MTKIYDIIVAGNTLAGYLRKREHNAYPFRVLSVSPVGNPQISCGMINQTNGYGEPEYDYYEREGKLRYIFTQYNCIYDYSVDCKYRNREIAANARGVIPRGVASDEDGNNHYIIGDKDYDFGGGYRALRMDHMGDATGCALYGGTVYTYGRNRIMMRDPRMSMTQIIDINPDRVRWTGRKYGLCTFIQGMLYAVDINGGSVDLTDIRSGGMRYNMPFPHDMIGKGVRVKLYTCI